MLQQTQVATVEGYFHAFVRKFPTLEVLAGAKEEDVLSIWAGLGYYSRARNLLKAARQLVREGRQIPSEMPELMGMPGVGRYTAAAIASIAYHKPFAVLDGNVARVLSRLFAMTGDMKSAIVQKRLWAAAESCLDHRNPGDWNQAMMELGALVCLPPPELPRCMDCPVRRYCIAWRRGLTRSLPRAVVRRALKKVSIEVVFVEKDRKVLLSRRSSDERLLPGHWALPESRSVTGVRIGKVLRVVRHSITHHDIRLVVREGTARDTRGRLGQGCFWIAEDRLSDLLVSSLWRKAVGLSSGHGRGSV